jgi:hypothetical protein
LTYSCNYIKSKSVATGLMVVFVLFLWYYITIVREVLVPKLTIRVESRSV